MDSFDTIKKFENMMHLKYCLNYHPAMNGRAFAAVMFLDGNRYSAPLTSLRDYAGKHQFSKS